MIFSGFRYKNTNLNINPDLMYFRDMLIGFYATKNAFFKLNFMKTKKKSHKFNLFINGWYGNRKNGVCRL